MKTFNPQIDCQFQDRTFSMSKGDFSSSKVRMFLGCLATTHSIRVEDLTAHEHFKFAFPYSDQVVPLSLEDYLILFLWLETNSQLADIHDIALLDATLEFLKARAGITSTIQTTIGTKKFATIDMQTSPSLADLQVFQTKRSKHGAKDTFKHAATDCLPWIQDIPPLALAIQKLSSAAGKDSLDWSVSTLNEALERPIKIKVGTKVLEYKLQGRLRRTLRWLSMADQGHYPLDPNKHQKNLSYILNIFGRLPKAVIQLGYIPNNQCPGSYFDLATILINGPYDAGVQRMRILDSFAQLAGVTTAGLNLNKHGRTRISLGHLGGTSFGEMSLDEYMHRYYRWLGARHRFRQILDGSNPYSTKALTIGTDQAELDKLIRDIDR